MLYRVRMNRGMFTFPVMLGFVAQAMTDNPNKARVVAKVSLTRRADAYEWDMLFDLPLIDSNSLLMVIGDIRVPFEPIHPERMAFNDYKQGDWGHQETIQDLKAVGIYAEGIIDGVIIDRHTAKNKYVGKDFD